MFGLERRAPIPTLTAFRRDLQHRDPEVRKRMMSESSRLSALDEEARREVIEALVARLEHDGASDVRGGACMALSDVCASEAVPALLLATDDESPYVRQLAIAALGEIGDVRARGRLRRAISDPSPEIRFQAVLALTRVLLVEPREEEEALELLLSGLADEDAEVREQAAETVSEALAGRPLPTELRKALERNLSEKEPPAVRVAAAVALAESKDPAGAEVLIALLEGDLGTPPAGRIEIALELLGELGSESEPKRVAPRIREALSALARPFAFGLKTRVREPSQRAAALVALLSIRDAEAETQVLEELASRRYERKVLAIGIAGRGRFLGAAPLLRALSADPTFGEPARDALALIEGANPRDLNETTTKESEQEGSSRS